MLEIRDFSKIRNIKSIEWSNLPAKQMQQRLANEAKEFRKFMGITYEEIMLARGV